MASRVQDGFDRPDGAIERADTGQPWVARRGSGVIKSGRAFFEKTSPGSLYTVDIGAGGGDADLDIQFASGDGGGQALYFRVVDVNRWWRLSKRFIQSGYSYQYQSGTTPETYGWVGNGTYRYEPAGEFQYRGTSPAIDNRALGSHYASYDPRVGAYLSYAYVYIHTDGRRLIDHYYPRTVIENQSYIKTGGGEPIYSTGYATTTIIEAMLEKCVNGTVSLVRSVDMSNSVTSLSVSLRKQKIEAFSNDGLLWSIEDPTHMMAQSHGIGFAESSEVGNLRGIDSFSATPSVITGYVPPLML